MNKKLIRLTESDFKQIVKESVDKVLNEAIPWEKYHDQLEKLIKKHPAINWNYGPYDREKNDKIDMDGLFLIYVIPIVDGKMVIVKNERVYITNKRWNDEYIHNKYENWTEEYDNFYEAKRVCMEANKILGREVFSPRGVKMNKYGVKFGHSHSEARPITDLRSHKHRNEEENEEY